MGTFGQAVFNAWRHLGIDFSGDKAVFFQGAKGLCQHFLRDVGHFALQLLETQESVK